MRERCGKEVAWPIEIVARRVFEHRELLAVVDADGFRRHRVAIGIAQLEVERVEPTREIHHGVAFARFAKHALHCRRISVAELPITENRTVTPEFFQVTKQRLIAGRLLRASDDSRPESPLVAVINESLVKRDFPGGQDPLGKRFYIADTTFVTIVGVVSDIKNAGPVRDPVPEVYWTYRQTGEGNTDFPLMIRVRRGDPLAVVGAVRAAIRSIDPQVAITDVRTMPQVIAQSVGAPRFYLTMLGVFAAVAVVLAISGIYGVLSYAVAQRTREFGIRSALGSTPGATLGLVTREGMTLIAGGVILGLGGAAAATRLLSAMLYGVSPLDPVTWIWTTLALGAVGVLASLIPALRATRADPLLAIRSE